MLHKQKLHLFFFILCMPMLTQSSDIIYVMDILGQRLEKVFSAENLKNTILNSRSALKQAFNSKSFQTDTNEIWSTLMTTNTKGFQTGSKESLQILDETAVTSAKQLTGIGKKLASEWSSATQDLTAKGSDIDKGIDSSINMAIRSSDKMVNNLLIKNMVKTGAVTIGIVTTLCIVYYGTPAVVRAVERIWTRPKLIISSSKKTLWQKIFGTKIQETPMIFSPNLEQRLNNIVEVTSTIQKKINSGSTNVKYRNLMLYGAPGTGKTLFATELAKRSGMEYACMSGSSFSKFKDGEGIEALDELFAWAQKSKGLLIFIDEAETFLSKRENMDPQSKGYQLLNNFLNYTGTRSDKFMIVFATNHKDALDSAMYRRIDDLIEIPLPGKPERIRLLDLYIHSILLNEQHNEPDFIKSVHQILTSHKIDEIAEQTVGLSGGEIEGIINTIKTDADICNPAILSNQVVNTAVHHAIEKHNAFNNKKNNAL